MSDKCPKCGCEIKLIPAMEPDNPDVPTNYVMQDVASSLLHEVDDMQYLRNQLATEKTENKRLREISDKLPKTADGVPIVPGDVVWTRYRTVAKKDIIEALDIAVKKPAIWMDGMADAERLYSTKAAAEAEKGE